MDLGALAGRQLADYDAHTPGRIFLDPDVLLTADDAYQVQRQVAQLREARGEAIAGFKIGCVSPVVQRQLGVDRPVFGHLFANEVHSSGVMLDAANFESLAIEGEIAVRTARDLRSADEVNPNAIASLFPVIELHNQLFRRAPSAAELIANNALHAGIVIAGVETPWGEDLTICVFRNGELLGSAAVSQPTILASLAAVIAHVAAAGLALRGGQIVLTGSPLPLYPAGPGDRVAVESTPAGRVELRLAP